MTNAPHYDGHHNGRTHGLQYLGAVMTLVATVMAIGSGFAVVTYNMGRLSQRVDQVERDIVRIDATNKETQKENNFRITILERKASK